MTEVWKSNARKFCELCKVWFADNRVSIEHHEGGQKHKAAIQAKLRELGKQKKQAEKEKSALQATLALMESAANKSMKSGDSFPSAGMVGPVQKPKKYMDPRAHGASVAEIARQMAQRKKEQDMERKKSEHKPENAEYESENETVWVEAKADSGVPYYFHMYSGVTVWEKPKNYYTMEQYATKLATMEGNSSAIAGSLITEPNNIKCEPRRNWGQQSTSGTGRIQSFQESSANDIAGKAVSERRDSEGASPFVPNSNVKSDVVEGPPTELQTAVKFEPEMDAANFVINECDIPLPPSSQSSEQTKIATYPVAKEEPSEEGTSHQAGGPNDTLGSATESVDIKSEPEKGAVEEQQPRKPSRPSPYGEWVPVVKAPEKPKIDWELPSEKQGRKRPSEPFLAPEDVIAFSDKSAAVKKNKKIAGPIEFRKRKTAMSIRRPLDDQ